MKKLIVLSVIFALVAGSAFAADVGAEVFGSAELLNGTTKEVFKDGAWATPDAGTAFGMARVRLGAAGQTEDGTIGGWLRAEGGGFSGFAWWKPIEQVKVQIGANPDGEFGLDGVAGWGFHMLANEVLGGLNGHIWGGGYTGIGVKYRDAFFGGYGVGGLVLNINPIEALAINIGVPLGDLAKNSYLKSVIQVKYDIGGVGTFGVTFQSDVNEAVTVTPAESNWVWEYDDATSDGVWVDKNATAEPTINGWNDTASVFVYFGLSAIENLGIDLGIGYKFADTYSYTPMPGFTVTATKNNPLAVSLAASFSSEAFGLKARVLGEFGGSTKSETTGTAAVELSDGIAVLFDILPYFTINDKATFYLSAGIGLASGAERWDTATNAKVVADADFAWHVEPYLCITPSYWSGAFFVGFRVESSISKYTKPPATDKLSYINWSIPIGITCSF